jgi:hypothetical protein
VLPLSNVACASKHVAGSGPLPLRFPCLLRFLYFLTYTAYSCIEIVPGAEGVEIVPGISMRK